MPSASDVPSRTNLPNARQSKPSSAYGKERLHNWGRSHDLRMAVCLACSPASTQPAKRAKTRWLHTTYACSICNTSHPPQRFDTTTPALTLARLLQTLRSQNSCVLSTNAWQRFPAISASFRFAWPRSASRFALRKLCREISSWVPRTKR